MKRSIRVTLFMVLAFVALAALGCSAKGCSNKTGAYELGLSKDEIEQTHKMFVVRTANADELPTMSSEHLVNVPPLVAYSKAFQGMNNYDHADAKAIGYDFDMSTVFQPGHLTPQLVDGHNYYVGLLDFRDNKQAAYDQMQGIIPGIIVVDAEDETKPAQVRLRNAKGKPYKIVLNFRDVWLSPNYIGRFLKNAGVGATRDLNWTNGQAYIDDVTPEVEDGTWDIYYSATLNQCNFGGVIRSNSYPLVQKIVLVRAESADPSTIKTFTTAAEVPKWVDRIYSEEVIKTYIKYWGFNTENFLRMSDRGRLVLDNNELETVVDKSGDHLDYVGLLTSTQHDNTALGIIMVPTNDITKAVYYPLQGDKAIATREQAYQVMEAAVAPRPWNVDSLTLQFLYGHLTWEATYVHKNTFREQDDDGKNNGETITCEMIQGIALTRASSDMDPDNVVWDVKKQAAFDKYENLCFVTQPSNVGARSLEEFEADGRIEWLNRVVDQGQTSYLFGLSEPKYRGVVFRGTVFSSFDRETLDLITSNVGDHVAFKYGDTKTSPTCFVKQFHNLSRNAQAIPAKQ